MGKRHFSFQSKNIKFRYNINYIFRFCKNPKLREFSSEKIKSDFSFYYIILHNISKIEDLSHFE